MTSYLVIALFGLGIVVGWLIRNADKPRKAVDQIVTWAVYLLLFLLGISVGINNTIIENFSKIGYMAVCITMGAVGGSVVLAKIVYKLFFHER